MKNKFLTYALGSALLFTGVGCQRIIETQEPQQSIAASTAINSRSSATAAMLGAYSSLQSANYYGTRYLLFPEMHGQGNANHTGTFPSFAQFASRAILDDNVEVANMWAVIYSGINRVNQIIDRVPRIDEAAFTAEQRQALLAEAHFLRAFHYFNLVRYWGGVPLITRPTNAVEGSTLQVPRSTVNEVYTQILADLDVALASAPTTYGATAATKGRATIRAVQALKARVHLYRSSLGIATEWDQAIQFATLAGTGASLTTNFVSLFEDKNTVEAIWELQFDPTNSNSVAFFLLPTALGGRNEIQPNANLAGAFPAGDARRITAGAATNVRSRVKYFRPGTGDDHVIIFRLAEMLLTRAEALVERNTGTDLADAVTLINQIRTRAGIGNYAGAVDQVSLRNEVFLQRRLELALEGHYFFDLVRTGRAATTFANWNPNQALLPIPFRELNANPNLTPNPR
jgi:hypothetical protein